MYSGAYRHNAPSSNPRTSSSPHQAGHRNRMVRTQASGDGGRRESEGKNGGWAVIHFKPQINADEG
jgi:hypothetical protein